MKIEVGSKWVATRALKDPHAFCYTVRGVTDAGIYITCPESRSPGHLFSEREFLILYRPDPREDLRAIVEQAQAKAHTTVRQMGITLPSPNGRNTQFGGW